MCLAEVLAQLRAEGLDVKGYHVHSWVNAGHLERPPLNSQLAFVFAPRHVKRIRQLAALRVKHGRLTREALASA